MRRLIIALLFAATGCSVGPEYIAPKPPVPSDHSFLIQSDDVDKLAPLPRDWWRLYKDPVLDDLISRAFNANTDLRVAVANLENARAMYEEASGNRLPMTQVSGGTGYGQSAFQTTGQNGPGASAGSAQFSYRGGLTVAWELDLFGRIKNVLQASQADTQAVEAARDMVRVVVAAETARSYLDACAFAEAEEIAKLSLANAVNAFDVEMARVKAGASAQLNADQAAAVVARARAVIPEASSRRKFALFELAALIGETPGNIPEGAASCSRAPSIGTKFPVGSGSELLNRRPDLREAERTLAAETARIGVATADLYPRISFAGSANQYGGGGASLFSFSLGPLISWSFPNQRVARSKIKQAEASSSAALATFDGRVLNALKEVEQFAVVYAGEAETNRALLEARNHAEAAFKRVQLRHKAGAIPYLEVLVSQRQLFETRATLTSSIQRLGSRRIDLFKALGGGWESDPS